MMPLVTHIATKVIIWAIIGNNGKLLQLTYFSYCYVTSIQYYDVIDRFDVLSNAHSNHNNHMGDNREYSIYLVLVYSMLLYCLVTVIG